MFEDDNNTVGYGNPPKHHQFKKGQSGNPKGRPSNRVLHEILQDVMNEVITVMANGEKIKMTKKEAFVRQLMNDSMKGKSQATKTLIKLLKDFHQIFPI